MVTSVTDIPTDATSNIILAAQLYAAPGKADELEKILFNIQTHAKSDAEPGCLEYRPARSFVGEGVIKFILWEVYKDAAALNTHFGSKPFAELLAGIEKGDLLDRPPTIEYFYEI